MPPKKKIKLNDTLDNIYYPHFDYPMYTSFSLTEGVAKSIKSVNNLWKIQYNAVDEEKSMKIEISVDCQSRYLFDEKVTLVVYFHKYHIEKKFELEQRTGQKFQVDLDFVKTGSKKAINISCRIYESDGGCDSINRARPSELFGPDRPHDVVLVLGYKKVHVLKKESLYFLYLATWSKFFNTLFFGESAEKDKKEFEIKDVGAEQFSELMFIIHPSRGRAIDEQHFSDVNVTTILKLAARFEMPSVVSMCLTYLGNLDNRSSYCLMYYLELADKCNIPRLQVAVLKKFHSMNPVEFREFLDKYRDRIKDLSVETIKNLI